MQKTHASRQRASRVLVSLSPLLLVSLSSTLLAQCPGGVCPVPRQVPVANPEGSRPHPAVCRIVNQVGQQQNLGTGTLVAKSTDRAWVITCAHLFREGTSGIQVLFPDGDRQTAQLVAVDSANDLAVLSLRPPRANPATVNTEGAAGTLTACGYGQAGRFVCAKGRVIGYATPVGATDPSTKIAAPVRLGDSGGAVFSSTGEFCGVIWGMRDGVTYATCGRPLRNFLDRVGIRRPEQVAEGLPPADSFSPRDAIQAQLETLAARIERLEQSPAPESSESDLSAFARVDDVEAIRSQSDERQADTLAELKQMAAAARAAAVSAAKDAIAEHLTGLPSGIATWLPATLGLTGPAGLGVGVLAWLGIRRIRKRLGEIRQGDREARRQGDSEFTSPALTRPIAVDSPPPPQQVVPETHYVTVEGNEFAKAHQWAAQQVARKYPGSTEVLGTLDSLIKQQINAK